MKNEREIKAGQIWNEPKMGDLKRFIEVHDSKRTKEQRLKVELLAIQYKLEDYLNSDGNSEELRVIDFVKMYLKVLNITQKRLAQLFEMQDSNLHKYLTGDRKLNASVVLKLSSFSHTNPEYWLRLEVKNELMQIKKEQAHNNSYKKYDYRNLLVANA